MNQGKIVQIVGAVVDVEFSDKTLPGIYNALEVKAPKESGVEKLILEVQSHLGEGWVRTVAMGPTDGLKRGTDVIDTGKPISVPVGEKVLGRVLNVVGEPIDNKGPVNSDK